jgi:F-type H+-transporting ATPase subunit epsilon
METQHSLQLTITSVDRALFSGPVHSITVPSHEGELTLLARHEPLITLLREGNITVRESETGTPQTISIVGGILETSNNQVTVLV